MLRILRIVWRFTRNAFIGLSLVLLLGLWILRAPWAQNRILPYVESFLSQELGAPVEVGGIDIHLPGKAVLRNVYMRDQQSKPMFSAHEVRLNLLSLPILSFIINPSEPPPVVLNRIDVVQPEAHLYRSRRDSIWNYAFLIPESDSTPSKPPKIHLEFPDIHVVGGLFSYVDSTRSDSALMVRERLNVFNLDVRGIRAHAKFRLLPGLRMEGDLGEFSAFEDRCRQMVQELSGHFFLDPKGSITRRLLICLEHIRMRTGRTQLIFDGELADARPDSVDHGFHPLFSAHLSPSVFDFGALNLFLPKPLPMRDPVSVKGFVWGDKDGIYSDSMDLGLYRHTRLRSTVSLLNYQDTDEMRFQFGISDGQVSFDELQMFLRGLNLPLRGIARLKGTLSGNLKKLYSRNLQISYLEDTDLLVDAQIDDFQEEENLFMTVKFKESFFSFGELRKLLPAMQLPDWMNRFGRCSIDGKFVGGVSDFVVNAEMGSAYGDIHSDLHLVLPPRANDIQYNGKLKTINLNLAGLGAEIPVQSNYLNFEGEVNGIGTSWGNMVADIKGNVTDSDVEGFHLNHLTTENLKIDHYKITGSLLLSDPQGSASVNVDLSVPDSIQKFIVKGNVDSLDLAHYRVFPKDSIFLSSVLNVNLSGDSIENYAGKLSLYLVSLVRRGSKDTVNLKNVTLSSKFESGFQRNLTLKSSIADMHMRGSFSYKNALRLVNRLGTETGLYIKNNDTLTNNYYANKVVEPENVVIYDTFVTKPELNKLMKFFRVPLYLDSGTTVYAHLQHGYQDEVNLTIISDSVGYSSIGFINDSIQATLQKEATNNDLIGIGYVHFDTLKIGTSIRFTDVVFEPSALTNELNCFLRAKQPEQNNEIVLSTATSFLKSGEIITHVLAGASHLGVKGRYWTFSKENAVTRRYEHPPSLGDRYPDSLISRYHVSNLTLRNGNQSITLDGVVSKDPRDILKCNFEDVRIRSLVEVFSADSSIDGKIRNTSVQAWNLLNPQPSVYAGGYVDDFRYKEVDSIGMRFIGGWPYVLGPDYAGLRAVIGHWGHDSLIVKGWYNLAKDELDFEADSSTLLLSWAQPFVEGILEDMRGKVAVDKFTIKGSLEKPILNGSARFTGARFKVNFLNNTFLLSDNTLEFDNEKIIIPKIAVRDTSGGSAELRGFVYYNDTAGVRLDLRVNRIDNLLLMDTRKVHNESFYGHILLDGDSARITGYMDLPLIEAWVNSGDGSWLDIPLSSYTSASRLDFVQFVENGKPINAKEDKNASGFRLALRVNARPNARVRLIFDEFVGDIIEARGDGNLIINMDENGDMTMFGAYIVQEGDYHFTMENVLNKKFEVEEGGQIVWTGSPYEADLNLDAVYKLNADISALVPGSASGSRIPVEIIMHMKGNLNHPEITLDLALDRLNNQDAVGLESYFRGITYDQQELNKQVVSLLMFRRFTGSAGYFDTGASSVNVTSSISELVSNQVNFWIAQTFEDPNLGLEVNTNEFQDVELALRANLFDDKVTIERNGTIIGNTGNSFSLGDISMLIKLLPRSDSTTVADPNAGQLVMEIFNREDATISTRSNVSQGAGIFFKKDFDQVKDLLNSKGDMKKEEDEPKPKKKK